VLFLADRDAGEAAFDDERRERLAVDLGEDDVDVGEAGVGDPHLLAGQREAAVGEPRRPRPRAERVRARARFAEAVGADDLAAGEARQVAPLLVGRPERDQRQDGEAGHRAIGRRERGVGRELGCDHDRADLVEGEAAQILGNVRGQQAELAGAADQGAGDAPVLGFQAFAHRRHFLADEVGRGSRDQPVLVGQLFRREHRAGRDFLDQPRATFVGGVGQCRRRHHDILSKIPAAPIPPPTHMLTRP
jgi:hypothetical protein